MELSEEMAVFGHKLRHKDRVYSVTSDLSLSLDLLFFRAALGNALYTRKKAK